MGAVDNRSTLLISGHLEPIREDIRRAFEAFSSQVHNDFPYIKLFVASVDIPLLSRAFSLHFRVIRSLTNLLLHNYLLAETHTYTYFIYIYTRKQTHTVSNTNNNAHKDMPQTRTL